MIGHILKLKLSYLFIFKMIFSNLNYGQ